MKAFHEINIGECWSNPSGILIYDPILAVLKHVALDATLYLHLLAFQHRLNIRHS